MRAVDVGVGHHDDLAVAQVFLPIARAGADAERLQEVGELLVGIELLAAGARDVQDFSAQRQDRLRLAVARLLGGAAGGIAFHDEELGVLLGGGGAIGELAGEA